MTTVRTTLCASMLALISTSATALDDFALDLSIGNDDPLQDTLVAATTLSSLPDAEDTTPRDVIAAARADYTRIVEALYANGYYSGTVSILLDGREAAGIDPFSVPARIQSARILVDPGPLFTFGRTRLAPTVRENEALQPGQPALATVVRDATSGAVEDWRDAGHAKATVASQAITARHTDAQLDVDVTLAPGPRVSFGEITVSGTSTVKPGRVRQIAGLPRGEAFSPAEVEQAAERLRRTGTFSSVQITESDLVAADGSMDMDITVVDRKPRRIGAGVEFSSLDGLTLSGFWLHRNFFGGAERFRVDGEISQIGQDVTGIDYALTFRLEKPAVYGAETLGYAELGFERLDEDDYLTETAYLSLGVSREFTPTLTGDLGISVTYSEVTDFYTNPHTRRELLTYSLPTALTWDRRDNPLDAANGFYLRAEAEPFYEAKAQTSGARLTFDGRAYRSFGSEDRTVLAGRVQLGSLIGPDAPEAQPDALFYSGGGGTVRGQPYQSLDADYGTFSLGGRSFAGASAEVRYAVTDTIGVVAFADAGYIGTDSFGGDGDWHAGAGLGVRYKTPVGPIRVDVAGPLTDNTASGVQLYIGIGQAF
ncbi:autotransporter assembly complex protein TamA [Tropicibacter naphthalenivorans]|uniref:Autotransporter assembly factor TamA n=1 Tax=Tropicibacter naphthalenivorans TaxID=441103 RepID=A0A0N7LYI7_9RHOB|nr:autotransporter assembly complex family protein [Tropicibacter naphthalenivorans]CUH74977.1 Autotransporter assembly factor TamA [Tropicibacter naphthalenivorans]SMC47672.1 autotransporter secretion outer membrane protein TamA [Tropicibacter naphthalenivorans]